MINSDLFVARGQQLASLLLSAVPLAERMLVYHVAMTAWVMLPERGALLSFLRQPGSAA